MIDTLSSHWSWFRFWLAEFLRPKTLGEWGEEQAAKYLRRQGYKIVSRRDRSRIGELDLVAVDKRTVVFVEVKTRRSTDKGSPADAIDARKQRQLTRAALTFLKAHGLMDYPARFDVIAITCPRDKDRPTVEHIRDAFQAVGAPGQMFC